MDILTQRLQAIQAARAKGVSWEKAMALQLVPHDNWVTPAGMLALTGRAELSDAIGLTCVRSMVLLKL